MPLPAEHNAYNPPDLLTVVELGLSRLVLRNLNFAPTPEDIPITAEIMTEDLVRAGKTKHLQVQEALEYIGRNHTNWPQPKVVIDTIRDMNRSKPIPLLPEPEITDEQRSENKKKLDALRKDLRDASRAEKQEQKRKELDQPKIEEIFILTKSEEEESRQAFIQGGLSGQREYLKSIGKASD